MAIHMNVGDAEDRVDDLVTEKPTETRSSALAETLVRAGRAGDRTAFDRVYDSWFDAIYSMARQSSRDIKSAEELTSRLIAQAIQPLLQDPSA